MSRRTGLPGAARPGGLIAAGGPLAAILPFVAVLAVLTVLAWPTLGWPMAFDDLHLLRRFTPQQIADSFHGQWDPERLMTRGLRPLSLVFNHLRASAFGEHVAAYRVLGVVLLAAYWALLVPAARRVGTRPAVLAAAGVLFAASPYSVFHYVWITDGNHALQGLAFAGAAWLLCIGVEGRRPALAASLLVLLVGLLVREDTLAAVPMLLLVGLCAARDRRARTWLAAYGLALAGLAAGLLAYRARVVGRVMAPGVDWLGFAEHARRSLSPAGGLMFDAASTALVVAAAAATVAAWLLLALVPAERRRVPLVWLVGALGACAPGLTVAREDLLLFPVSFMALGIASAWAEVVRARPRLRPAAALALGVTVVAGAYVSRVYAENFHPQSLRLAWWNGRYLYGAYAGRATMPPERRAAALRHLDGMGIHNPRQHLRRTWKLIKRAVREGRRRPTADGRPFYPLLPWPED